MDFGLLYENDKGEYVVMNDVSTADICLARLFTCLVYISTYCVPIAHLRQNKPFPNAAEADLLVHDGSSSSISDSFPSSYSQNCLKFKSVFYFLCQNHTLWVMYWLMT